jgi:prevent-host-death family protein
MDMFRLTGRSYEVFNRAFRIHAGEDRAFVAVGSALFRVHVEFFGRTITYNIVQTILNGTPMAYSPQNPETINASEARQNFAGLLNRVYRDRTRVVVEKSGIPVAALVSMEDMERLNRLDRDEAERFAILKEMRAPFRDIPRAEIEREIDRALAEVRAENKTEQSTVVTVP